MKKTLIILSVTAVGFGAWYAYTRRPKIIVDYNSATKSGTVQVGNKRSTFDDKTVAVIPTWNGYEFSISANGYTLYRYGKIIDQTAQITPYMGGSSNITINQL